MKMNENSLFAILLRSQWWVSALIAAAVVMAFRLIYPDVAFFAALPFMVIAVVVAWKQLRTPGRAGIAAKLERLRAMPWGEFAGAVAKAYARQGYEVRRLEGAHADFELERNGRRTLVACKRWKATRTGIEPLRELEAARRAREADEAVYFAAGELSEQARAFAMERNMRLLEGLELVKLLA